MEYTFNLWLVQFIVNQLVRVTVWCKRVLNNVCLALMQEPEVTMHSNSKLINLIKVLLSSVPLFIAYVILGYFDLFAVVCGSRLCGDEQ